ALHVARRQGLEIVALLSTLNAEFRRVAMHGVREELLDAQAEALGLPLVKVPLPWPCPNDAYERAMSEAVQQARSEGIEQIIFGDLFLEDIRKYREEKLAATGITPLFPIWGLDTAALARDMVGSGLRAHLTCVDPKKLSPGFAGRTFDSQLLEDLPEGVDPCGENGEFHTFAVDGPMFGQPVEVRVGEVVERDGFVYADLLERRSQKSGARRQN
ncbi:MAG TPA: ATP-binding protein, partial [Terriglobia bacterium]|nr:ATP-binding protein [Terriglobia bacterium]